MPVVWWIFLCFSVCSLFVWITCKCWKIYHTTKNTRHVISLPIGTRFTMDDSDSIWVLIHLDGCGLSVEWRGDNYSYRIQKRRHIVNEDANLRHVVVKVVQ